MMWFEGALSVKAVMLAGRREVAKLAVDQRKKDKDTAYILHQADRLGFPSSAGRGKRSISRHPAALTAGSLLWLGSGSINPWLIA